MSESLAMAEAPGGGPRPIKSLVWFGAIGSCCVPRPALVLLVLWIFYPTIRTDHPKLLRRQRRRVHRDRERSDAAQRRHAAEGDPKNFLWILVVPAFVTAIGPVFAVLIERVRFVTAFEGAEFMPMATSLFAAGVIWRLMYEKDRAQGTTNAAIAVVKDAITPP